MGRVLGIVYRTLATHFIRKASYTANTKRTGRVNIGSTKACEMSQLVHSNPQERYIASQKRPRRRQSSQCVTSLSMR